MMENIFFFSDKPALRVQDDSVCAEVYDHFWVVMENALVNGVLEHDPGLKVLMESRGRAWNVRWLARYASAVVFQPMNSLEGRIIFIGLDGWQKFVHASFKKGREYTKRPNVRAPTVAVLGTFPSKASGFGSREPDKNSYDLWKSFTETLAKSEKNSTKTPSFAQNLFLKEMTKLRAKMDGSSVDLVVDVASSEGGTTDVGLHRGCLEANTSFPLVLSVVWFALRAPGQECDELFNKCVVLYLLGHLDQLVEDINDRYDVILMNRAVNIMREIESQYWNLIKDTPFQEMTLHHMETHRTRLRHIDPLPSKCDHLQFEPIHMVLKSSFRNPTFPQIPVLKERLSAEEILRLARKDAEANLGAVDLSTAVTVESCLPRRLCFMWDTNRHFWKLSEGLISNGNGYPLPDILKERKLVEQFVSIVDSIIKDTNGNQYTMKVVYRSYQVLAVWICYCFAHLSTERIHGYRLKKFGVALHHADLHYLVLEKMPAINALRAVEAFLKKHWNDNYQPFRNREHSLQLALDYALNGTDKLKSERDAQFKQYERRIDVRWRVVQQAQRELSKADSIKTKAEQELADACLDFQKSKHYDHFRYLVRDNAYVQAEQAKMKCEGALANAIRLVQALEAKRPHDYLVGLPKDENLALQWLFFIRMPNEFRDVCKLAHFGQSLIMDSVPPSSTIQNNAFKWYQTHTRVVCPALDEQAPVMVPLKSHKSSPAIDIRCYERTTGVFYPDNLSCNPGFDEYKGTDPFLKEPNKHSVTVYWTEKLPCGPDVPKKDGIDLMQTFMPMLPTEERENRAIAMRSLKPSWLTHEQYLTFSTLRAFPHTQIRLLLGAVVDSLLPFDHPCVHMLVKQTLYHVGDASWKNDFVLLKGIDYLLEQLFQLCDLNKDNHNAGAKLLLFGSMSSFLGQYPATSHRELDLSFSKALQKQADTSTTGTARGSELESEDYLIKHSKLYGYSILCLSIGETINETIHLLAKGIVLFRRTSGLVMHNEEIKSIQIATMATMSERIIQIDQVMKTDQQKLTDCLHLVVEHAPEKLSWSHSGDNLQRRGCFEARSGSVLYSINLLKGIVLVNGVPPGLLPDPIVQDPLFTRSFGERNFNVTPLGERKYKTCHGVESAEGLIFYEFKLDSSNCLHITEHVDKNSKWQLLRRESLGDLPITLKEQYSHWYSHSLGVIAFRGKQFDERVPVFLFQASTSKLFFIRQEYMRKSSIQKIICQPDQLDQLVLGKNNVTSLIERFEFPSMVHVFQKAGGKSIIYELTRYNLSFEQLDTCISSITFLGFQLSAKQKMNGPLLPFKQMLILDEVSGHSKKVLIPDMHLDFGRDKVLISEDWDKRVHYHIFDIHPRFQHLIGRDCLARFQLACIYAKFATLIPNQATSMSGMQSAVNLARQCWQNEPYSFDELEKLKQLAQHSNLCPTLKILCCYLWKSSTCMNFLFPSSLPAFKAIELSWDSMAADEYLQNKHCVKLSAMEEKEIFGFTQWQKLNWPLSGEVSRVVKFIESTEEKLKLHYIGKERRTLKSEDFQHNFALQPPKDGSAVEGKLFAGLQQSYSVYQALDQFFLKSQDPSLIRDCLEQVQERCSWYENELIYYIQDHRSLVHKMSQLIQDNGEVSLSVLLQGLYDDTVWQTMNFGYSEKHIQELNCVTVDWALLCVFEDKLNRMDLHLKKGGSDQSELLEELRCIRTWSVYEHRRWLVFEVEHQLMIRPCQYAIVKQLQEQPNTTIQLNMGEGKTRVITPMLIMDAYGSSSIPRISLLSSISKEAIAYYRNTLVASAQNILLYLLPFQRDFPLSFENSLQITDHILHCRERCGCIVVTPQHRNSILLRQYDVDLMIDGLKNSFLDIIDESDAILSHDFQLVYALGNQEPLPSGPSRWLVLEALIRVLVNSTDKSLRKTLSDRKTVHFEKVPYGGYTRIRLHDSFFKSASHFGKQLCQCLLASPPYELCWLESVSQTDQYYFLDVTSNPECRDVMRIIEEKPLFKHYKSDILALRGFIAYGLLFQALSKRCRVDFGVNIESGKLMAVPFSASDTPKPRAEYSHPDMALLYTTISYLHDGLSKEQFRQALLALSQRSTSFQEIQYNYWIKSIGQDVNQKILGQFDNILKVDVDNGEQFHEMYNILGSNMEVVFFWLNHIVFPNETDQFPSKRVTNAWNLVDSGHAVGFSGTDDNQDLLPLFLKHEPHPDLEIQATNGKMVDLVLKTTRPKLEIIEEGSGSSPMWKNVLQSCLTCKVDALIDVSGLMAGCANDEVAKHLSTLLGKDKFDGVVYFDKTREAWSVYEVLNGHSLPLSKSTVDISKQFVFFDESRCRGANILQTMTACALVTLELNLTKDKFLQGCARMRKLGVGRQSLILGGTLEVISPESSIEDVLKMIISNTATSIQRGIPVFFGKGMQYHEFPNIQTDKLALDEMYANELTEFTSTAAYIDSLVETRSITKEQETLVSYCKQMGTSLVADVGNVSQECEREFENEKENEEEEELEIVKQRPSKQVPWDFQKVFTDPESLFFDGTFVPLHIGIQNHLKMLACFPWSHKLFCTKNFWNTIVCVSEVDLSLYLRQADAALAENKGGNRFVLLSVYDLENLLPLWWNKPASSSAAKKKISFSLIHLYSFGSTRGFCRPRGAGEEEPSSQLKLFRGYTKFSEEELQSLYWSFCRLEEPGDFCRHLLNYRARLSLFERSDLEVMARRASNDRLSML